MDQVGYDGESAVCFGYLKSLDAMNTTDFISFYILNDIYLLQPQRQINSRPPIHLPIL